MTEGALDFIARLCGVELRVLAYRPRHEPGERLKLVVQRVVDGRAEAVHPLLSTMVSRDEFDTYMRVTREDGWDVRPWAQQVGAESLPTNTALT